MVPTNVPSRLIDQALSLLRNVRAHRKTVVAVAVGPAESKAVPPSKTPLQGEPKSSVSAQAPLTIDIATAEPETLPTARQLVTQQVSRKMSPTEPRVEEVQTPSLIDQTLSMVEQSLHQLVAKQEGVPAPPVQEQRTASLIGQTLAMVAISGPRCRMHHLRCSPPLQTDPPKILCSQSRRSKGRPKSYRWSRVSPLPNPNLQNWRPLLPFRILLRQGKRSHLRRKRPSRKPLHQKSAWI